MNLRTITRISAVLAVLCTVGAAVLTFVVSPASALLQERIIMRKDDVKEVVFPLIAGNNPTNQAADPTISATSVYCDTIPVTFERGADFVEGDEYFVQVQLIWDTMTVPQPLESSGQASVNDMDMYIYNDPVVPDAGEDHDGVIARGATQGVPETTYLFAPVGDYSIVIINYLGNNPGYTIKLTWVSETFTTPFESTAPPIGGFSGQGAPITPPARPRLTPPTPPLSDAELGDIVGGLPIPTDGVVADAAFDTGSAASDFESDLVAPSQVSFAPAAVVKPEPPSGVALVLWLVAAPLAILAIGGTFLMRRNQMLLAV